MPSLQNNGTAFALAFGSALRSFLVDRGMTQVEAARTLGLINKKSGKPNKSRLNAYLSDSPPVPGAEVLYLACTRFESFKFEYNGFRISAETIVRKEAGLRPKPPEQMAFTFNRQFNLTDKKGAVTEEGVFTVRVKRPPGHVEVLVSLKANSAP
jgi:transcriptional regulator with XRE-family HTH domain